MEYRNKIPERMKKICKECGDEYDIPPQNYSRSVYCPACKERIDKEREEEYRTKEAQKRRERKWWNEQAPKGRVYTILPREDWGYAKATFSTADFMDMLKRGYLEHGTLVVSGNAKMAVELVEGQWRLKYLGVVNANHRPS